MDDRRGRRGAGRLALTFFTTKDTKGTKSKARTIVFLVSFVSFLAGPKVASAQIYESIGVRAQGMGGAFVAVSDDATTTWWNPAGLASGSYLSGVIEFDRVENPTRTRARAFALNIPSLGLSYYRFPLNGIQLSTPTGTSSASREDQGVLSQFGATVGQSLGSHLILGSTLKLVHVLGHTRGDLDLGAMANLGMLRLGVAVKNVRKPEFSEGDTQLELPRQARAGASVRVGALERIQLVGAVDADLTTTKTAVGDERHLAAGAEAWLANRAVGVRAGVGVNTIGPERRSGSVGLSVGLRGGFYLDGQLTRGADEARNGWGVSLRVTF